MGCCIDLFTVDRVCQEGTQALAVWSSGRQPPPEPWQGGALLPAG